MPTFISSWRSSWISQMLVTGILLTPALLNAQEPTPLPPPSGLAGPENPTQETRDKEDSLISEVLDAELIFTVDPARSKVVRTKQPISRIAVTNPSVVEVNEFGAHEFEVIGLQAGETTLTIWFGEDGGMDQQIIRYLVKVAANEAQQNRADIEYGKLESRINELFPNSQIQLFAVADKLIVRGQCRDSQEASQIVALLGGQSVNQSGSITGSSTVVRLPGADDLRTKSLVNLLNVPGEHQVMLNVRIAELTRSSARELGVDFDIMKDSFSISNFITGGGNLTAILDHNSLQITGPTRDVCSNEPVDEKFRSFGWNVQTVDGHDFDALTTALTQTLEPGKPNFIIANTVKGKGVTQEMKEKIILAVGNVEGVGEVEDGIEPSDDGPASEFHTVVSGDTLWAISKRYYNKGSRYKEIFEANRPMLKHPDKIYVGQVLRIPADRTESV